MDSKKKNVAVWAAIGIVQKRYYQDAALREKALKKILRKR
jgi:hypothetical protein